MNPEALFRTVKDALLAGTAALQSSSDTARLDAEVLLTVALGNDRAWLFGHPESELTARQTQVYSALLAQRASGRPVAQLTGRREFWSLDLLVNDHTLVPRPETESLVEQALTLLPRELACRLLDLGTGSGAIAVALATERPQAEVIATDSSKTALEIARQNAARHCPGRVRFYAGTWFAALPANSPPFDLIVSNPPYIGEDEAELTDPELAFEPVTALYSGKDGLRDIRAIISGATGHLRAGGWLLLEHGFTQADAVMQLLQAAGFRSVDNSADLAGRPRLTRGQWP